MKYLMTQSLLNSYLYQFNCIDDYTEEAHQSFLNTLNKIYSPPNEAIQRGIDFERLVYEYTDPKNITDISTDEITAAINIADYIQGGRFQYIASKTINVNGLDLVLYGRLDALKAGVIYDIKYTSKYNVGKFIDSPQHPMYLELIPEAKEFIYLVSNGKYVWTEKYTKEETPSIYPIIQNFFEYLNNMNLMQVYKNKWKSRY